MNISQTMRQCLEYMSANDGVLERYPGGFWAKPGWVPVTRPWFGTTTVEALHSRKLIEYTDWKKGRAGRQFPVEARIVLPNQSLENDARARGDEKDKVEPA